jgi:hypothetical protein
VLGPDHLDTRRTMDALARLRPGEAPREVSCPDRGGTLRSQRKSPLAS